MLYLAIPAHNEVATIGVLLWRLRTVLAEFPREYEVVVYDDASSDETAVVAEQYMHAMPVTVLRGTTSVGYAGAVDALVRHIAAQTRYPRRDAMLLLQGDFTDPPGIVPEFARRFEGGADLVIGERSVVVDAPVPVRRLFTAASWALKPFVRVDGVRDLTSSMRLVRISVLRDLIRTIGDAPVCEGDSWTANADLLLRLIPHARKVETVPVEPTYGVRTRETRRVTVRDALAALRWGWRARSRKAVLATAPEGAPETAAARGGRNAPVNRRRDEPELTADSLRERSKERDRLRGDVDAPKGRRDGRPERPRRDGSRALRLEDVSDSPTESREARDARDAREEKRPREPRREPRTEPMREPRRESKRDESREESRDVKLPSRERPPRERKPSRLDDPELILDDPFAGKSSRNTPLPVSPSALGDVLDRPAAPTRPSAPIHAPIQTPTPSPLPAARDQRDDAVGATEDDDAIDDTHADSTIESATSDAPDDASDESSTDTPETRERKRRRNRRSRRRRSKTRGDAPAAAESDSPDGQDSEDAPRAEKRSAGPRDKDRGQARSQEHVADDDGDSSDDDEASGADDEAAIGPEGDAARAKARRRGRRGRRGGSRRSRGRGRDGAAGDDGSNNSGDNHSDNGGGAGDAPPTEN